MTPERWQHIKNLVNSALIENSESHTTFLQQSCAEDLSLRLGAEALLSFHEDATRKLPDDQAPLSPQQWQRIEQLFQSALELDPAQRAAYLNQHCSDDEALRREVESLLVYQAAAGDVIQGAVHEAAGLLAATSGVKARFTPGTTLNKRYRIIGLLGKGGMGEVYRADDLKLGQPVALKFLTEKLSQDKAMLARFHSEVAMAHRVTHPNVCRVHDIGEVTTGSGTSHFLTMEYVDGEDLSSLLRRIGRLPADKAVEIANQLCAGLSAAHDAGVLHRDLKPANVMLDGKGRVRITDFGLAGFAEQIRGSEVMAGTPAYMSPEQFAGKEITTKSDLYALGLVLYEIFTGKRVFEAGSLEELRQMHASSAPTTPSSWVKDIDPLVERVILQCLEKDPAKRLSSAKQVADALPGGDPLAAALALGETPSPEMVAAAGQKIGMKPKYAVACLVAIIVGLIITAWLGSKVHYLPQVMRENSPDALVHKARDIIQRLGYTDQPVDQASGAYYDFDYIQYVEQQTPPTKRWEQLTKSQPSAIVFWYRQSPDYLLATLWGKIGVGFNNPPQDRSGMVNVALDTQGRLRRLEAVPPQRDQSPAVIALPDWASLFSATGLELSRFSPTEPQWVPPTAFDARGAWTGSHPNRPEIALRIEAAAYRGKPVYFRLIWPWEKAERGQIPTQAIGGQKAFLAVFYTLFLALPLGAVLLARHNFRQGRTDQRGAFRLAAFVFLTTILSWMIGANHVPTFQEVRSLTINGMALASLWAVLAWLLYIALEPFVRKRWPSMLISWGRVLNGDLRDPLVGRDLLIGTAIGVASYLPTLLTAFIQVQNGTQLVRLRSLSANLSGRYLIIDFLDVLINSTMLAVFVLFLLLLLRILTRRQWLATSIIVLLPVVLSSLGSNNPVIEGIDSAVFILLSAVVLLRFGLLALIAYFVFGDFTPLTSDFSAWYGGASLWTFLVVLAIAAYAFHTSLGGQKLFTGKLLEE